MLDNVPITLSCPAAARVHSTGVYLPHSVYVVDASRSTQTTVPVSVKLYKPDAWQILVTFQTFPAAFAPGHSTWACAPAWARVTTPNSHHDGAARAYGQWQQGLGWGQHVVTARCCVLTFWLCGCYQCCAGGCKVPSLNIQPLCLAVSFLWPGQ